MLKSILSKILYKIINRFSKNYLLKTSFSILKHFDFEPNHILDIGANHGTWTRETLKYFPNSYYTMVEPQKWLKESFEDLLKSPKINYHPIGMGKENGSFKFTVVNRDDSSSFRYTEEEAKANNFKQIEIPVKTIDTLISENQHLPKPDLIKIDAEGLDLEVIEGASNTLNSVEVIMIEAAITNYEFNNDIRTVLNFMYERGFKVLDFTDLNRPFKSNILWLVELIFIKKGGIIDQKIKNIEL